MVQPIGTKKINTRRLGVLAFSIGVAAYITYFLLFLTSASEYWVEIAGRNHAIEMNAKAQSKSSDEILEYANQCFPDRWYRIYYTEREQACFRERLFGKFSDVAKSKYLMYSLLQMFIASILTGTILALAATGTLLFFRFVVHDLHRWLTNKS